MVTAAVRGMRGLALARRAATAATAPRRQQPLRTYAAGQGQETTPRSWQIRMLYDGDCPLCMREVNMLRRRDSEGKIDFVDIAGEDYDPAENQGIDFETAMGKIHAITSEGEVVTNVEVFRRLYDLVGLGWVFAITRTEPFGTIVDKVYDVWAAWRLPITGRETMETILAKRRGEASTCRE